MKPTRIWLGLLFLGLGVFGVLDVTGVLAWNDTVGQWWPLAIIAFGIADMATEHRITFGQAIITAIGVALLADQQNWASDNLIWSLLLGGIGLGILFGRGRSPKPEARLPRCRPGGISYRGPAEPRAALTLRCGSGPAGTGSADKGGKRSCG